MRTAIHHFLTRRLPSVRQLFFATLAIVALLAAGELLPSINEKKADYHLVLEPPQNAPPSMVMASAALGGFRGLLLDYLWLRAIALREEGSHYEIVQLYSWICQLEPRIAEVWSYTAHEMAYNISVTLPTPEERWRWILRGMEQLRDLGILYNPESPKLYWELAFLFHEKLGVDSSDVDHFFYQLRWAELMEEVLGDQDLMRWAEVMAMLMEIKWEPGNGEVAKSILEVAGTPYHLQLLLAQPRVRLLYEAAESSEEGIYSLVYPAEKTLPQLEQFRRQHEAAYQQIEVYVRAKRLREQYKMNPRAMLELSIKYGDLDWRVAAPHALYWAEEELKVIEKLPKKEQKRLNVDILRHAALNQIFEAGRVVGKDEQRLYCVPNFTVMDALNNMFEEIERERGLKEGQVSHEEFLSHAIFLYCMYNGSDHLELMRYCTILATKFPSRYSRRFPKRLPQNDTERAIFKTAIEEYVKEEVGTRILTDRRHIVESLLIAQLQRSYEYFYRHMYEGGDYDRKGEDEYRFAQEVYQIYYEKHGDLTNLREAQKPRSWEYFRKRASSGFKMSLTGRVMFLFQSPVVGELNEGIVSEKIREIFQQEGSPLKGNAQVKIGRRNQWVIYEDEKPRYMVREREGMLYFYTIKGEEEARRDFALLLQQYGTYLVRPDD